MAKDKRLFARLDLDYADHPKIAGLSDAAFRAHISFILYARKYETDGVIRNPVANRMGFRWDTDVLTELLNNDTSAPSLSQLDNGDYLLHGFSDMQETKAEIADRKHKNSNNGARGGRPRKPSGLLNENPMGYENETQTKAETETETELTPLKRC